MRNFVNEITNREVPTKLRTVVETHILRANIVSLHVSIVLLTYAPYDTLIYLK